MWWIEELQLVDEWDEKSGYIWVLVSVTIDKKIAESYLSKENYRVTKK